MLNTSTSAQEHLFKTLSKVKLIAEHPDLPPEVKKTTKSSSDTATLNVIARLCKSNQGKTALDVALADIQQALGIKSDKPPSLTKPRQRAKDFDSTVSNDSSVRQRDSNVQPALKQIPKSLSDTPEALKRAEDDDDDDDDVDTNEDWVAFSEHDTSDEFSNVDDLEQRLLNEAAPKRPPKPSSQQYDVEADLSLSGSNSNSVSASPEPQKASFTKKTSFLPSLTMGGYISGSDSEVDDVDIAPKKNRRGQRARQQIWEQKYGMKAKHLQNQGGSTSWDPKRGAVEGNVRQRGSFGRERRSNPDYNVGGDPNAGPGNSKPGRDVKKTHRDDGGALHPSWEAAKKAKEKKEASGAFQGKKITFD
jgi:hypothetical protein